MAEWHHDSFSRSGPTGRKVLPAEARHPASIGLVVCLLVAIALLALGRADHRWIRDLRSAITSALRPAFEVARLPVRAARVLADAPASDRELLQQVAELKRENHELKQWRQRAEELASQVSELRRLVAGVPDRPIGIATGRVFVEGAGGFSASAVIDVGTTRGVRTGFAAVNGDGLVGTVVDAAASSARVLLVSDRRSRIPVFVGKERLRGILAGNGGALPSLELVMGTMPIEPGALVTTSGEDGVLPRGVPVGFVQTKDGIHSVRLNAELGRLDFVSILLFEPPGSDLAQGEWELGQ
jgi:rod shape-determining protein MreC